MVSRVSGRKLKVKMTRILIILISTIGLLGSATADTIDYWNVYYNKARVKEFNVGADGEIVVKIRNIKSTDSLMVEYYRDTPCFDCLTKLTIENKEHFVITKGAGIGTFNPIKISVYDLLQYHLKAGGDFYEVFYQEDYLLNPLQRRMIFRIKLE